MIGRKLTAALLSKGELSGRTIQAMTLADVVETDVPASSIALRAVAADLSAPGVAAELVVERPDVVFHLAAIVSGEAEADFEKGYRINLDGTRELFEAVRRAHGVDGYRPRLVFTSSVAVFGQPLPPVVPETQVLAPLSSYGTQKAIGELLLADYSRRGFMDGIGIRLPTIVIRPGKPNKAASGFFSGILREPLAGLPATLPVGDEVRHWFASPRRAVEFVLKAAEVDTSGLGVRRTLDMPDFRPLSARRSRRCGARAARRPWRSSGACPTSREADHRELARSLRSAACAGARLRGRRLVRRDHSPHLEDEVPANGKRA